MLLPAVVFSNYRRKGEEVLLPTRSHRPSEAQISSWSASEWSPVVLTHLLILRAIGVS